ncbi:type II toxin-antitoxin system death-on-curing family toxin [Candidatus Uhrbacteria bacterium]|nr:type II toxin-antitoxin system death-on-curing family toxin [Candidatus Uhrbacteria bacterium]
MQFHYLDAVFMEKMCHRLAMAVFDTKNDPISPFQDHITSLLDSALNLPRATFGGKDLYPSIVEKATILYYSLNRNHPFRNGNKRISTVALLVFLYINGYWLDAGIQEMTDKALFVAKSEPRNREETLNSISVWIRDHLVMQ